VDAVHDNGHQEQVGTDVLGEQLARQVLVDDRFHADHGGRLDTGRIMGMPPPAQMPTAPRARQPPLDRDDLDPGLAQSAHFRVDSERHADPLVMPWLWLKHAPGAGR
jgi:hypothetical protein